MQLLFSETHYFKWHMPHAESVDTPNEAQGERVCVATAVKVQLS